MAQSASQLFLRLVFLRNPGIKAWAALAVIFAIALFGYYLVQGVRYWQASGDVSAIRQEIRSLDRKINSLPQSAESKPGSASELERQLSKLEDLEGLFRYPGTDDLLAIVSSTAVDAELELQSMRAEAPREEVLHVPASQVRPVTISAEAPEEETVDVLAYQVRPVTITMAGPPANLARFLTSLQQRVPMVSAPSLRIAGLDQDPKSKIQLLFYLSPHAIPKEENASAGLGDGGPG